MKTEELKQQKMSELVSIYGTMDAVDFEKRLVALMKDFDCLAAEHKHEIWQNKSTGIWFTHVDDPTRKEKRKLIQSKSKDKLIEKLKDHYGISGMPVDAIYAKFLDQKKELASIDGAVVKTLPQTLARNDRAYKSYIAPSDFSKLDIKSITEGQIEDFITSLKKPDGSPITQKDYNIVKTLLRNIFSYARKRGYTDIRITEVLETVEPPATKRVEKKNDNSNESFNEIEQRKIVRYLSSTDKLVDLSLLLCLATGVRIGELAALEVKDVHSDYIEISKTEVLIQRNGDEPQKCFIQEWPKTSCGNRKVYLSDSDKWILVKILNYGNKNRKYLFEDCGKRYTADKIRQRFRYVLRKLGIAHRPPHKLRKSYASNVFDKTKNAELVRQMLGHSDLSTTLKTYIKSYYTEDEIKEFLSVV